MDDKKNSFEKENLDDYGRTKDGKDSEETGYTKQKKKTKNKASGKEEYIKDKAEFRDGDKT